MPAMQLLGDEALPAQKLCFDHALVYVELSFKNRRQGPQKTDDHRRAAQDRDRIFRRHWLGYEGPVSQLGPSALWRLAAPFGWLLTIGR